jgi:hypothetical protein
MSKYQFFQKYFRYQTDTCTLPGYRPWCQIVGPKNKALEKKGESIDSDSPFLIAITSEYRSKFQK